MLVIHVCIGSACHLKGAYNIIDRLQQLIVDNRVEDQVTVKAAFCLGECSKAVSVRVGDGEVTSVHLDNLELFFRQQVLSEINQQK